MFTLIRRGAPYVLAVLGVIMVVVNVIALLGPYETNPTRVPVSQLQSGEGPEAQFLTVTNGALSWEDGVEMWKGRPGIPDSERLTDYFIPLIPSAAVDTGSSADAIRNVKIVFVRFSPEDFATCFPGGPADDESFSLYEPTGMVDTSRLLIPQPFEDHVVSELKLSMDSIVILEHGARPVTRAESATAMIIGCGLGIGGAAWIRRRRSAARSAALKGSAWSGVGAGLDNSMHDSVSAGVRGAYAANAHAHMNA